MADDGVLRVLIADDEPLVRRGLRTVLADEPDVTIVGEARDGDEAVQLIRALAPALVFLDVQMPGRDGFAVLDALEPAERPAVVFVTAFDVYAVRAFDVQAVDYVLKPFDDERLRAALGRVRARLARRPAADAPATPSGLDDAALEALLRAIRTAQSAQSDAGTHTATSAYLQRLLVRERDRTAVVPVDAVDWFEADDNYVRLHTRHPGLRGTPLLRETLTRLAAALDPRAFARVHRSALVRLAAVHALEPLVNGEQSVVLRDGTRLTLGRTHRAEFEARLRGLNAGES